MDSPSVTLDCLVSLLWHSILMFRLEYNDLIKGSVISATSKERLLGLILKYVVLILTHLALSQLLFLVSNSLLSLLFPKLLYISNCICM